MSVRIKRVYDPVEPADGLRVLVDRLWPRGVRKDALEYERWEKDIAPTPELRKWFGHDPNRWQAFHEKYREALAAPEAQARLRELIKEAGKRNITLLYGARDPEHNHAVILADAIKRLY